MLPPPEKELRDEVEYYRQASHRAYLGWTIYALIVNMLPLVAMHDVRPTMFGTVLAPTDWASQYEAVFIFALLALIVKASVAFFAPLCAGRRIAISMGAVALLAMGAGWVLVGCLSFFLDYDWKTSTVTALIGAANLYFGRMLSKAMNHELLRRMRKVSRADA